MTSETSTPIALERAIEAILMVADEPQSLVSMATALSQPVKAVKSGCANGLIRQRTTKVAVSASVPPGPEPSVPL